MKAVLKSV